MPFAIEYVSGITTIVRNAGSAAPKSVHSMSFTCATMSAPTTTSPAAATSSGTTWVSSGVRNIDARNSSPVTTEAMPVRAPSPMPDAESMNTVFDDTEAPPPAIAPAPSTTSADFRRGKVPSGFATRRPSPARSSCPWRRRSS